MASGRADMQLRRAEKPWKPQRRRGDPEEGGNDPQESQTQELLLRVRIVLNKLTPQRFQPLMQRLAEMPINSEHRLKGVVEMVFQRAVSEPQISVVYANVCHCLKRLKVPMAHDHSMTTNFRKLLLNRCQTEFQRNLDVDILERKQIEFQIYACIGGDQQQRLKEVLEEIRGEVRQRSLGVVKFMGELFKLKMLNESIIDICIISLLQRQREESLECLCVLLSSTGKDLDNEKIQLDQHFNQIEKIMKDRKTPNRIRFMLQDVVDLRRTHWIPRHSDPGPQTIDAIREQATEEKVCVREQATGKKVQKPSKRKNKGPKGPGASVCVSDTLPNIQIPKPGTLDLITHLLVLGAEGNSGGSGAKPSDSVKKGSALTQKKFLSPPAAAAAAAVAVVSPLEEDLSCPVCCDIYTDPVVLPCSHSFCRPCLEKSWRQCVRQECLICRQKSSTNNPTPNRALRNVCESFLKEKSSGAMAVESSVDTAETHSALCPEHEEKLQFYCQDEDQLGCVECVMQRHKTHNVYSARRAASERRDELKCLIKSLEDDVKTNKTLLEGVMTHVKAQADQAETQIKEEFEKLHRFLRGEEEVRIAALRKEERDKTADLEEKIEAIERVMSSLSERMRPIQELMETDEVSFIQTFSETKERVQDAFLHPQPGFWLLLDVSKYVDNLSYRVWDRMKKMVANSPVMVDSNTSQAQPDIFLPEHLASFPAFFLEPSAKCDSGEVARSPERIAPGSGDRRFTSKWMHLVDDDW
ncbi:uncharacterized protein LOC122129052 isoform X3 [Clupea harengus]|uniref:Uncharacterized protein LOC122129052 isoform X3 n=1 Tax=Clupea harengus TaxID=7950 RepID=A0A8M1KCK8_CLUHA|nr:uncharacterized protein LOC122129052 isoform X3 [Clupea harengus]